MGMMIAASLEWDRRFSPGLATRSKRLYPRRQNFGGAEEPARGPGEGGYGEVEDRDRGIRERREGR